MLERTYELQVGPRAVRFEEYEAQATAEYRRLLSSDGTESDLQIFLERNPLLRSGSLDAGYPFRPPAPALRIDFST